MSKYLYSALALVVLAALAYIFLSPDKDGDRTAPGATTESSTSVTDRVAATNPGGSDATQSPANLPAGSVPIAGQSGSAAGAAAGAVAGTTTGGATGTTTGTATTGKDAAGSAAVIERSSQEKAAKVGQSLREQLDALGISPEDIPVQSPARPHDMDIMAPVLASETDDRYNRFVSEALPEINEFLKDLFQDRPNIDANTENMLLEDLLLEQAANVRVYFIKEGTVFHNTLGIVHDDQNKIIFPDASSRISYFRDAETRNEFTSEEVPLLPGDYVDLGVIDQGELLDLFLIQDGARNEDGNVYYVDPESNIDKVNHVKFHGMYEENILIIGFEDLKGGGDRDYNDLVIAVELTPP